MKEGNTKSFYEDTLTKDSMKVRKNSMIVNKEFDEIEYDREELKKVSGDWTDVLIK